MSHCSWRNVETFNNVLCLHKSTQHFTSWIMPLCSTDGPIMPGMHNLNSFSHLHHSRCHSWCWLWTRGTAMMWPSSFWWRLASQIIPEDVQDVTMEALRSVTTRFLWEVWNTFSTMLINVLSIIVIYKEKKIWSYFKVWQSHTASFPQGTSLAKDYVSGTPLLRSWLFHFLGCYAVFHQSQYGSHKISCIVNIAVASKLWASSCMLRRNLFFRVQLSKFLSLKGEACHGVKCSRPADDAPLLQHGWLGQTNVVRDQKV